MACYVGRGGDVSEIGILVHGDGDGASGECGEDGEDGDHLGYPITTIGVDDPSRGVAVIAAAGDCQYHSGNATLCLGSFV